MTALALYFIGGVTTSVCSWALSDTPPTPAGLAIDGLLWPLAVIALVHDLAERRKRSCLSG